MLRILSAFRSFPIQFTVKLPVLGRPAGATWRPQAGIKLGGTFRNNFKDSLEWICAFSYVFGGMCVSNANAYVRVRSGGILPPQKISIDVCALAEWRIRSKSRGQKIRDRDVDFHQNVGSR